MAFISGVLALLLAPGPTNTLMGISGAQHGMARVVRLLPSELAGYLTAILPLSFIGARLVEQSPAFALALKVMAAIWIMILAVKLWRAGTDADRGAEISAGRVYVTTLLNPKALVFALVLLPTPHDAEFAARLGLFCLMVTGVALVWGGLGMLTRRPGDSAARLLILQRVASAWLAFVSLSLAVSVMQA